MKDAATALRDLVDALDRRTRGLTGRQFESMVSPAMGAAYVNAWHTLGLNGDDIPAEWQGMADSYNDLGE